MLIDGQSSVSPLASRGFGCAGAADPVDRAEHDRLRELRGRATQLVPGAGIDDEQAAVGVLDDVGRMEVAIVGDEEVLVAGRERRAARHQDVARDLSQVEHRGEETVAIAAAERARCVAREAGRHGRPELAHDRHQIAGPLVAVEDVVRLAVDAAVDGVDDRVPLARLRMLQEGRGEDAFALRA